MYPGFLRPTTTPTPDELFDVWLSKLSGSELKVLLYIVRRTFGFQKEADAISLTQICEGISTRDGRTLDAGTGLTRTTAYKAVPSLEKQRLIQVRRVERDDGSPAVNVYSLRFRNDEDNKGNGNGSDPDPKDGPDAEAGQESDQGRLITNPGAGQALTRGGLETNPGVGQKSTPQQTEGQETETQLPAPPPERRAPESAAPAREMPTQAGGDGNAASETVPNQPPVQLTLLHPPPASHTIQQLPVTEERQQAVDALVEFGVWRAKAEQLVDKLGLSAEEVERACAALNLELKRRTSITNPGAVLVARLESGWEPPTEPPNPYSRWGVDGDDDEEMATTALPVDRRPVLPPVVTASGTEHNAYGWFAALKSELQLQLARETYDTWLRTAELVDHVPASEDAPITLTVRLHNVYAKAWVEHRLDKVIRRQAVRMLGKAVQLVYVGPEDVEQQPEDPPWWERARPDTAAETERSAP